MDREARDRRDSLARELLTSPTFRIIDQLLDRMDAEALECIRADCLLAGLDPDYLIRAVNVIRGQFRTLAEDLGLGDPFDRS